MTDLTHHGRGTLSKSIALVGLQLLGTNTFAADANAATLRGAGYALSGTRSSVHSSTWEAAALYERAGIRVTRNGKIYENTRRSRGEDPSRPESFGAWRLISLAPTKAESVAFTLAALVAAR